ncbi:helix-turn-helix domain-containing protein [Haloferax sp. DFSO60]|uniref:helix-turn-helix domain-containing protein n=1 Tax=Haloferax sp. DFSO60 TaxID=3388652 RepID=UPI00397C0A43
MAVTHHGASEGPRVVGEVTVDDSLDDATNHAMDELFVNGSSVVYRYTHDDRGCPCSQLSQSGCPIRTVHVESGRLVLSFIVPDVETLRAIIAAIEPNCDDLSIRHLTRSGEIDDGGSLFVVDRSVFTDRQYEVLETAYEMGYFESPKRAKSKAVAEQLDIAVATFVGHLSVAQTKLLDQVVSA